MTDANLREEIARTMLNRQGFEFYDDPMEGGQNAYDISCEALDCADAILAGPIAVLLRGLVCERGFCRLETDNIVARAFAKEADTVAALIRERDEARALLAEAVETLDLLQRAIKVDADPASRGGPTFDSPDKLREYLANQSKIKS